MTYNQLKSILNSLTENQLNMDVTLHITSQFEFYPVPLFVISDDTNDVLDITHPYFEI